MGGKNRHRWEGRLDTDGREDKTQMGGKTRHRWEGRIDTDGRKD